MATVIGILRDHFTEKNLPVVKPRTNSKFTHIDDTIEICYKAWKDDRCNFYSVLHKESYSILQVAKMFNTKIKFLKPRRGERYSSASSAMSLSNKVYKNFGKRKLKDYISDFIKKNQ